MGSKTGPVYYFRVPHILVAFDLAITLLIYYPMQMNHSSDGASDCLEAIPCCISEGVGRPDGLSPPLSLSIGRTSPLVPSNVSTLCGVLPLSPLGRYPSDVSGVSCSTRNTHKYGDGPLTQTLVWLF